MMVDMMAWAGTAAVAIGVLTRLPAATTRFVRALVPLVRACRDLRAELKVRRAGRCSSRRRR
jgi:hypothetical protein